MVFGLGLLLGPALRAAEDGGQPLAFNKLAVGARPAAMGGAFGAVGGDAYGMISNPSLLATLTDLRVGSQWASLPTGSSQQFLGFGRPFDVGDSTSYGLTYDRYAVDVPIEKRIANTPDADSVFGDSSSILTADLAGWLSPHKLALGASIKVLAETLGDASSGGFSFDAGLFMRTWDWLDLGLAFQDAASHLTWNTGAEDNLPLVVRSSAAVHLCDDKLLFSTDVEKSEAQTLRLHLGAEVWAVPQFLALRLGWNQGQWSTGFGLRFPFFNLAKDVGLDYALASDPLGDLALQHRFSLNLGFGLESEVSEQH
jgi:hypothetical protein